MSEHGRDRGLRERLFGWATGRDRGAGGDAGGPERVLPTKALIRFVSALRQREAPVLLDLGPVVGSNVTFFGERLGCKILVEDFYADLERFAREGKLSEYPAFLATRLTLDDASVDGILCWDLFDYLERPAAQALGRQLVRLLKPGGALLGFFATKPSTERLFTKYVVGDEKTLRHRPYPATRPRQRPLVNRDINLLLDGLRVSESFLLLTNTREILFRKPG